RRAGPGEGAGIDREAGTYRVSGLQPGGWRLRAVLQGYAAVTADVEVRSGRNDGPTLRIGAGVAISGRLADEAGAPIAGASVYLSRSRGDWDLGSARTAADGGFRLRGIPPGPASRVLKVFVP